MSLLNESRKDPGNNNGVIIFDIRLLQAYAVIPFSFPWSSSPRFVASTLLPVMKPLMEKKTNPISGFLLLVKVEIFGHFHLILYG